MSDIPSEVFKPIPVRRAAGFAGHLTFALRSAADLQLLTCTRFLAPHLTKIEGDVLDVGCGEMPFRSLIGAEARYTGLDVPEAASFGMSQNPDIAFFDGEYIPFPDASFDHVLCTEVLEHAENPEALIREMHRVLRRGGTLLATIPFAARVHHAPHDYHRFTRYRLAILFRDFQMAEISERGDDISVIANKLIVLCIRLLQARPAYALLWRLPALLLLAPAAVIALAIAHLSLAFNWGSRMDPLGYGVFARKG